ncbi:MAG: MoaD/ThiS family protein [Candidatus Bathyarchaeia archaeon]
MTAEEEAIQSKGEVSIKLLGAFGSIRNDHITVEVRGEKSLTEFLENLTEKYALDLKGFGSYFLVLIDGVEASLLGGLEAKVKPRSELALIRVSHGG